MKKIIILTALMALVAWPVSAATQKATLINEQGNKVVVNVGSQTAQLYFSQGYKLMKPEVLEPKLEFGSVMRSGEYNATSTLNMLKGRHTLIQSSYERQSAVLGSIIIASSSPATTNPVRIWNATTTATDLASSTVFKMPSDSSADHTFDIFLSRGLILELPAGFLGDWLITFR